MYISYIHTYIHTYIHIYLYIHIYISLSLPLSIVVPSTQLIGIFEGRTQIARNLVRRMQYPKPFFSDPKAPKPFFLNEVSLKCLQVACLSDGSCIWGP